MARSPAIDRPAPAPSVGTVVLVYLAVLPLGHLVPLPLGGATATLTDLVLAVLVLAGGLALLRSALSSSATPFASLGRDTKVGLLLLVAYGGWTVLSAIWGFHGGYAFVKGAGLIALVAGAYLVASSAVSLRRLLDTWLLGTAAALLATLLMAVVGGEGLRRLVIFDGGLVAGIPFPRLSGPFFHPNLFGEYLVVSAALLWVRTPGLRTSRRPLWLALIALIAFSLLFTASTAWLAAGVALLVFAGSRRYGGSGLRRGVLALAGVALAGATLVGAVRSVSMAVGPLEITTGGIRPEIWADALGAVAGSPVVGVGAAPYLAETADPLVGASGTALWDAHSTYLSVLGQLGVVGGLLFFGGLAWVARGVRVATASDELERRLRFALFAVLLGLLAHWITLAGEDFRHLWALVGLAGWLGRTTSEGDAGAHDAGGGAAPT